MSLGHCAGATVAFVALVSALAAAEPPPSVLTQADRNQIRRSIEHGRGSLPHEAQLFGHAEPGQAGAQLGYAVSVFGDTAVVGAALEDTAAGGSAGAAYVFVRFGTSWYRQARLLPSDGASNDLFGVSVSVSGDTAVVGAFGDDTAGGSGAGSAYVFVRSGSTWTEQQKLTAPDGQPGDGFGYAVSVSGDTVLVGAPNDDTPGGPDAGSAYVFVRAGTVWSPQQQLVSSDPKTSQLFGASVAVDGETVGVGAPFDSASGGEAGAAYVFVRSGTVWTEEQKLLPSDGAMGDLLGVSVSISGDTAVVGAFAGDTPGGTDAGSAYVFLRSGGTWTEQQKVTASDGASLDHFGMTVSLSVDTVVVGAPGDDGPGGADAGSAYVFVRSGTTWSEQQKLMAPGGGAGDAFGSSASLSGDTVVVGAPNDDAPGALAAGSACVFVRTGTTWTGQQKLAMDMAATDWFGYSVSVAGDTAVVGATFDVKGDDAGPPAGSAYVFVRSGTTWTEQQKLQASDGLSYGFGRSASLSGDTLVIGAVLDQLGGGAAEGFAYVFVRSGTTWTEQQKLEASDGTSTDFFGASLALSGDTIVVGAAGANGQKGAAYVYVRSGTIWTEQQKIVASDGATNDAFGASVSLFGDTALVGAPADDTAGGLDAGSAYVLVRSGTTWTEQQKLVPPDSAAADYFGSSVFLSGDTALVGAPADDTAGGVNAGSAYVFVGSGATWTHQQKLLASDGNGGQLFGSAVSLSGEAAVVGAPEDGIPGGTGPGTAYVFARSGTTWNEHAKLLAPDGAVGDDFGRAVSIAGDTVVMGAPFDATPDGADAGSAHVFRGSVPVELEFFTVE